jgi:hypothetical protein
MSDPDTGMVTATLDTGTATIHDMAIIVRAATTFTECLDGT